MYSRDFSDKQGGNVAIPAHYSGTALGGNSPLYQDGGAREVSKEPPKKAGGSFIPYCEKECVEPQKNTPPEAVACQPPKKDEQRQEPPADFCAPAPSREDFCQAPHPPKIEEPCCDECTGGAPSPEGGILSLLRGLFGKGGIAGEDLLLLGLAVLLFLQNPNEQLLPLTLLFLLLIK